MPRPPDPYIETVEWTWDENSQSNIKLTRFIRNPLLPHQVIHIPPLLNL